MVSTLKDRRVVCYFFDLMLWMLPCVPFPRIILMWVFAGNPLLEIHRMLCSFYSSGKACLLGILVKLQKLKNFHNEPWIIGGDFNEILYEYEKSSGNKINNLHASRFLNVCKVLQVHDSITSSPKFTWTNKWKGKHNIKEKLDRFFANQSWKNTISRACAVNSGYFGSDHRAIKLLLNHKKWVRNESIKKNFMFENKWLMEENFLKTMRCWEQTKNNSNFPAKLVQCGNLISNWAKEEVGNTKSKIDALSKDIESL